MEKGTYECWKILFKYVIFKGLFSMKKMCYIEQVV